jgi:hypothetical protein
LAQLPQWPRVPMFKRAFKQRGQIHLCKSLRSMSFSFLGGRQRLDALWGYHPKGPIPGCLGQIA